MAAKGYWMVHVTITDAENYPKYLEADKIAFDKYNAKIIVRGGAFSTPEGYEHTRHVLLEFESYEQALACYHSPEYQAAVTLRQAYAKSDVVIVEGVPEDA